tara:strand:- start:2072 stop:2617 length:546 start_codon:yes stop_codon:yes gene_type:complete
MAVYARFFMDQVKNEDKSVEAGHAVFDEAEMVEITIGGSTPMVNTYPVKDKHREQYAAAYGAYKKGEEAPLDGVPLTEWPQITAPQVDEFKRLGVRTVEDLVGATEQILQSFGPGGMALSLKAKAYLEAAAGPGKLSEEVHSLRTENDALHEKVDELTSTVNELAARLGESEKPRRKKKVA